MSVQKIYISDLPELLEEWDYNKNTISPSKVTVGSSKKIWWLCKEYQHSWQAIVNNRTKHNQGCPYCGGKRVLVGFNDLSTTNPDVAAEWDYDKNGDLKPTDVTRGCNKNVWWSCQNHHSWQARIGNRTKGYGCPYCSGERAVKGVNDLTTVYPNLLEEWDFNKNTGIDIYSLLPGSNKKVWWKCSKCGYEWNSVISSRTSKQECGCPMCANRVVVTGINDLATTNPELLEEWDYNKNKNLDPKCVIASSPKKAWWICKNCGRSWQTEIRNRKNGLGCAVCSGKACGTGVNDLETICPWLVEEYDTEKNELKPSEIAAKSHTKVWWKCSVCGKAWEASVADRTGKWHTGCPHCNSERHTSFPEQTLFFYITKYFLDTINGFRIKGCKELDIYIPSLNTAIEYDGVIWHKNTERDEKKNKDCIKRGIKLIRVREEGLPKLKTPSINYEVTPYDTASLEKAVYSILSNDLDVSRDKIDIDISRDYVDIQSRYRTLKQEKSLSTMFPEIAKEWCYERNGELTPDKLTIGSGVKVWWKCSKCGHEWRTNIYHRTSRKSGCPICQKKEAHRKYMAQMLEKTTSLQDGYPLVAAEWNHEKNGNQTPYTIAAMSHQKAWWKCSVCGNEWQATVSNRTRQGAGCPECARLKSRYQKKCRRILCVETQKVYNSIAEIERELGIHHSCIIACCKGKHKTAGGFHWRYTE